MAEFVANPLTVTLTAFGEAYYRADLPYVRPELAQPLPSNLVTDILQLDRVDLLAYQ